jgi:hypothetical protein
MVFPQRETSRPYKSTDKLCGGMMLTLKEAEPGPSVGHDTLLLSEAALISGSPTYQLQQTP